ncbi:MAG TPA: YdeI/OmpD-associated family protein [Polyangiaceae bacterium]|jgi:hypothetical protein|nr:YdeI/OmpD-associated family protein [Polyangiaceae bacterium]
MVSKRITIRPKSFVARVQKVGINPYVRVPAPVLAALFGAAGRARSPIAVKGNLNQIRFRQTLVKHRGVWRLYLNTPMRRAARVDVGDDATVVLSFDPRPPATPMNLALERALAVDDVAKKAFDALVPSRKKEISRYLNSMKTDVSLARNVENVLRHLTGKRPRGIHAVLRVKT